MAHNSQCNPAEKYTVSPCSTKLRAALLMVVIKFVIFASGGETSLLLPTQRRRKNYHYQCAIKNQLTYPTSGKRHKVVLEKVMRGTTNLRIPHILEDSGSYSLNI